MGPDHFQPVPHGPFGPPLQMHEAADVRTYVSFGSTAFERCQLIVQ